MIYASHCIDKWIPVCDIITGTAWGTANTSTISYTSSASDSGGLDWQCRGDSGVPFNSPCTWTALVNNVSTSPILCDSGDVVTSLNLVGITGSLLPRAFAKLTSLTKLRTQSSSLTGQIPSSKIY